MTNEEYKRQQDEYNHAMRERNEQRAKEQKEKDQQFYDDMGRAIRGEQPRCFVAGTMVSTPSGRRKIEALRTGETVYAFCSKTGEMVERPIKRHVVHRPGRVWQITTSETPQPIGTTGCHVFLTEQGWKRARQLRSGDRLRTETGWAQVEAAHLTSSVEPLYNLVVAGEFNFVANGAIAHSFAYFRVLRTFLHRIEGPVLGARRRVDSDLGPKDPIPVY